MRHKRFAQVRDKWNFRTTGGTGYNNDRGAVTLRALPKLEENMLNEVTLAKTKTSSRKPLKVLCLGAISLMGIFFVARLIWTFSGSNQWEFHSEKNGVKVYTLKAPGSPLLQVKAVTRVHTTVARLVEMVRDPAVCADIGCIEARTLERVNDQLQYDYFQADVSPFQKREFVIQEQFHQNPDTKAVSMLVSAVPDKIPPNPCCFRITQMNNSLQFTPLGNGEVEIEYVVNQNEGGFIPDLFLNLNRPRFMYNLQRMQDLANRDKYANATFDFIKEIEANRQGTP